ncbi:MAG: hydantoinase/oxoprolinase family protein [Alphaproteobacteria bacterium]|nr:hydantoinase/oxoprolinase family protein [Alphaproteobacteria bacterium]
MDAISDDESLRIGVDIGGTFTDCVILAESGRRLTTKALTTPDDPENGVLDGLASASETLSCSVPELLTRTTAFVHGTTVGTNALAQRRGARTGLLMTRGHEQTITIGRVRQKIMGLSEREKTHITHLSKADPPIVAPEDIRAVTERVDVNGNVVVALDHNGAIAAVDELVASGIEALAICLLWSFVRPDHERQIAEYVRATHPDIYLSLSSEVAPLLGEYERSVSTVFNSYIGPTVGDYLYRLETQLKGQGMACSLLVMQSNGGLSTVPAIRHRPLLTIDSGPAGGVLGGHFFSDTTDARNIICADVGGTTFDVGLVFDDRVQMDPLPVIDQYAYLTPKIYIKSIGAGGGSIAWVDNGGSLRVGPHSAGALPGPACYGRGGTAPTVTDAHLVLGYLSDDHPLGGTVHLDRSAAEAALATVAERLSMPVIDLAAGIAEISSAQMADLMRKVTVERGLDPRGFIVFAYGGAGPVYAPFLARQIGARMAYVPSDSGMFSALGMLTTDLIFQEERSFRVRPPLAAADIAAVNGTLETLSARVAERFVAEGIPTDRVQLSRAVDMRFAMQVHELDIDLPDSDLTESDIAETCSDFVAKYEQTYGENSAYLEAGMEMVTFRVTGLVTLDRPTLSADDTRGTADSTIGERQVYFTSAAAAGDFVVTQVHDGDRLRAGQALHGPAIVQRLGDTVVVPPGTVMEVDNMGGLTLRQED